MIKLSTLIKEINVEQIDKKYPFAGDIVDGREVLDKVDNTSSIAASLYEYEILEGIREIPMSDIHATGRHYSVRGTERIKELAKEIKESNSISPLIVVMDDEGPYILEGSTRIEALYLLKAKSFPALVVVDTEK